MMNWKKVIYVLGCSTFGVWLGAIYLFFYYVDTNPPTCQPALGKIYQLNNHGQIAYIDFDEKWTLNGLYILAGVLFVAGSLIYKWKRAEID